MSALILSCGHQLNMQDIPDSWLIAEWNRRRQAKRVTRSGGRNGGRPKVLRPCPKCGLALPAVEMRRHKCEGAQCEP